jgi:hypothetical protein
MNIEYVLKICQSVNTEDVEKKTIPRTMQKKVGTLEITLW